MPPTAVIAYDHAMPATRVRTEQFTHTGVALSITMPASADELIDEDAFGRDERLPYWADLWPSSLALSKWLIDHPPAADARIIELGCGMALPSLVLMSLGLNVLATDWEPDALDSAAENARYNRLGVLPTRVLDWRDAAIFDEPFDLAVGADLMYEQRNAIALADLLPQILKPNGTFILADPGRRWLPQFQLMMKQRGRPSRELAQIEETQMLSTGEGKSKVRIMQFQSPANSLQ